MSRTRFALPLLALLLASGCASTNANRDEGCGPTLPRDVLPGYRKSVERVRATLGPHARALSVFERESDLILTPCVGTVSALRSVAVTGSTVVVVGLGRGGEEGAAAPARLAAERAARADVNRWLAYHVRWIKDPAHPFGGVVELVDRPTQEVFKSYDADTRTAVLVVKANLE